jgi:hypothetical protein
MNLHTNILVRVNDLDINISNLDKDTIIVKINLTKNQEVKTEQEIKPEQEVKTNVKTEQENTVIRKRKISNVISEEENDDENNKKRKSDNNDILKKSITERIIYNKPVRFPQI